MNVISKIQKDPFRLFFPTGALLGALGISPWIAQLWSHATYPADFHRNLMINGFLLAFIVGFLMTSIPRFTSTSYATTVEITWVFCCLILTSLCAFFLNTGWGHLPATMTIVGIITFGARRFINRKDNPPFTFVFVALGLALMLLTNIMLFQQIYDPMPDHIALWRDLFSNGAILSIVLGIGGRLIPGIFGWQEIVSHQRNRYEKASNYLQAVPLVIWIALGMFLASYFLSELLPQLVCHFLRAIVVWFFGMHYWRLYRFPREKNYVSWGIWFSGWSFMIGITLPIVWGGNYTHSLHGVFIGGFSLLTLLVGTRVILAHSTEGRGPEKTSKSILGFTFLFLLSSITRITAIIWPNVYLSHLGYAAVLWIMGLILWIWVVSPRLFAR